MESKNTNDTTIKALLNLSEHAKMVQKLMKTVVQVEKEDNKSNVDWRSGDVPKFGVDIEIIFCEQVENEMQAIGNVTESVAFGASEYARLLHIMVDARMERNLNQPRNVCSREEWDERTVDPWEGIAKLFDDDEFYPRLVDRLPNGIQRLHICMIDTSVLIVPRTAIVLKANWGGLKSGYCIAKYNFQLSGGQHGPESFSNYAKGSSLVMYTDGFLDCYPHLCADATLSIPQSLRSEKKV